MRVVSQSRQGYGIRQTGEVVLGYGAAYDLCAATSGRVDLTLDKLFGKDGVRNISEGEVEENDAAKAAEVAAQEKAAEEAAKAAALEAKAAEEKKEAAEKLAREAKEATAKLVADAKDA